LKELVRGLDKILIKRYRAYHHSGGIYALVTAAQKPGRRFISRLKRGYIMSGLAKYRLCFTCAFRSQMVYRLSALIGIFTSLFHFLVELILWNTLIGTGIRSGTTMRDMIAYIMINEFVLSLTHSGMANTLGGEIRDGSVAMRLIRPFSFRLYLLSSMLGENSYHVLKNFIPVFIAGCMFIGFPLPPAAPDFFMFTALLVLGIYIMFQIIFISALLAFWTQATWFLSWYVRAGVFFFGGAVIPLWFYPSVLQRVSRYLPFRYISFEAIDFYLGKAPLGRAGQSLGIAFLWCLVLTAGAQALWTLARKKLTVNGG
jgi:ABC-2 type transport system permease protein